MVFYKKLAKIQIPSIVKLRAEIQTFSTKTLTIYGQQFSWFNKLIKFPIKNANII